jgi:signal transduction histidine kinase
VQIVLEAVEGYALVLDGHRQVLAANGEILRALGAEEAGSCTGRRPGELLGCVHADAAPGWCGTGRHCSVCGAVIAILAAQAGGKASEGECRMTLSRHGGLEAREFRVRVSPLPVDGNCLYVAVLQDVSDSRRRRCLERLFFHDVMNTLHGLEGWGELFLSGISEPRKVAERIVALASRLSREVQSQQILLDAESGELAVVPAVLDAASVLEELRQAASAHEASRGRSLHVVPPPGGEAVHADPALLDRVLLNMAVNALEATEPGGVVRAWFERRGGRAAFSVHNDGAMSRDTALRVFERSFSTKAGEGRGLGTYGMKLLGERYLRGNVSFTSDPGKGTVFTLLLPPPREGAH